MSSGPPTSEQALQTTPVFLGEAAVRRHFRMAGLLAGMERAQVDFSAAAVQPRLAPKVGLAPATAVGC